MLRRISDHLHRVGQNPKQQSAQIAIDVSPLACRIMSSGIVNQPQCPLLCLPRELQLEMFTDVLTLPPRPDDFRDESFPQERHESVLSLLFTCRAIYAIAHKLFYKLNALVNITAHGYTSYDSSHYNIYRLLTKGKSWQWANIETLHLQMDRNALEFGMLQAYALQLPVLGTAWAPGTIDVYFKSYITNVPNFVFRKLRTDIRHIQLKEMLVVAARQYARIDDLVLMDAEKNEFVFDFLSARPTDARDDKHHTFAFTFWERIQWLKAAERRFPHGSLQMPYLRWMPREEEAASFEDVKVEVNHAECLRTSAMGRPEYLLQDQLKLRSNIVGHRIKHLTISISRHGWTTYSNRDVYDSHIATGAYVRLYPKTICLDPCWSRIPTTMNIPLGNLTIERMKMLADIRKQASSIDQSKPDEDEPLPATISKQRAPAVKMTDVMDQRFPCEPERAWGRSFESFTGLHEFRLRLEVLAEVEGLLDDVVECARLWTFPLEQDEATGKTTVELRFSGVESTETKDIRVCAAERNVRFSPYPSTFKEEMRRASLEHKSERTLRIAKRELVWRRHEMAVKT